MDIAGIGGVFIRQYHLENSIITSVRYYLPVGADLVESNLQIITSSAGKTSLVALVLLIWTASGAFLPLELALNEAWGVKKERGFIHRRVLAALMTLLCGYFILISVFATAMIVRFDRYLKRLLKDEWHYTIAPIFFKVVLIAVSFSLTVVIFALIYKLVPYTRIRFAQVVPAAVLAAFTWEIAKYGFTSMIRFSNYTSVYGSIATIIVILIWVYLSATIILFFAEYSAQVCVKKKR